MFESFHHVLVGSDVALLAPFDQLVHRLLLLVQVAVQVETCDGQLLQVKTNKATNQKPFYEPPKVQGSRKYGKSFDKNRCILMLRIVYGVPKENCPRGYSTNKVDIIELYN